MAWNPEARDLGKRAGAWRRRYFRWGSSPKMRPSMACGACSPARSAIAVLSHAVLARVHRRALQSLRDLPPFPVDGPPLRLGVPQAETFVSVSARSGVGQAPYEIEAGAIRQCLGERCVEVHHIGSTAVPALPAKPILDIGLGLRPDGFDGEVGRALCGLRKIGYRYLGNRRGLGGHFLEKGAFPMRTHALQLHPAGGRDLARLLRFRDRLRAAPEQTELDRRIRRDQAGPGRRWSGGDRRRVYLWSKAHWVNGLLLERGDPRAWGDWLLAQDPPSLYRMHLRRRPRSFARAP